MSKEDLLIVSASIEPDGLGKWYIKVTNEETDVTADCKSVREYFAFLQESVNASKCKKFQATWLPSPNATKEMIGEVGSELLKIQKEIDELEKMSE